MMSRQLGLNSKLMQALEAGPLVLRDSLTWQRRGGLEDSIKTLLYAGQARNHRLSLSSMI